MIVVLSIFVILSLLSPHSVFSASCFNESFDDVASIQDNWSCDGDGCGSTWNVEGGKLVSRGIQRTLSTLRHTGISVADFEMSVDIEGVEGIDQQIVFRLSDDNKTYYMVGFRYKEEHWSSDPANDIVLYKFVNGNYWLLKRADPSAFANMYEIKHDTSVNVRISMSGNNIKVFFGQWPVINYIDDGSIFYPTISSGGFGFQSWGGDYSGSTVMMYDNLGFASSECVTPTPSAVPTFSITPSPTPTTPPSPTNTPTLTPTPTPTSTLTPTLTSTPTQTPTNTPTPTVVQKPKVILIPGMGASWNSGALVYNKKIPNNEWKMTPFVSSYDSLIKMLLDAGYESGKDLLIWNYDWRKRIGLLSEELAKYLDEKVGPEEKFVIVGHSMGGVVGRVWYSEHANDLRVVQVISAGSPQHGAMDPYTVWNSGRVASGDDAATVALNVLLQLQKNKFDTKVKVLREFVPSMADLIPVYDFVKKNGKIISHRDIIFHNDFLHGANQGLQNIYPKYTAIVGVGYSTPTWVMLENRDLIDKILGYWPDGSLRGYQKGNGDGTVVKNSQFFKDDPNYLVTSNHGDVVDKALVKMADVIGFGNPVVTPRENIRGKRLFFIGSPAIVKAKCDGNLDRQSDELGFLILSPSDKNCRVYIEGTGDGTYHLVTGTIGTENGWNYFEGETRNGLVDVIEDGGQQSPNFLYNSVKRDLRKIGLGGQINTLERGDIFGVLKKVLQYRQKHSETAITARLIENLSNIVSKKHLTHRLTPLDINRHIISLKRLSVVDALNIEMSKEYMARAKSLFQQGKYLEGYGKMVVAGMLISVR